MSLLRLNIDQQMAQIGVRNTPAKLNISMPKGQYDIKTEIPQMRIDSKLPSFKMNRQKINNESGLKAPLALARSFRDTGRQAALRGARQAKDDGNFLANHRIPGEKLVPMLAKNKAMAKLSKNKELNIGLMPAASPEVDWDKGHMRVNWSEHSVVIDFSGDYKPQISVEQEYSVEVFLRTKPYIRVSVEEALSSARPGRYIDRNI